MERNINHFKVVGISYHLATVEQRERFTLSDSDIHQLHHFLAKHCRGGFVLSTCNRTEIYFVSDHVDTLIEQWAALSNVEVAFLQQFIYKHQGKQAIQHLFRVGTGLDSQILGDFQIIGQIKSAYKTALADGAQNNKITRMIDKLLRTSKRVKNETELSSGVASMAYASIQHLGRLIEENWSNQTALVYGAGKMGSAVVRKLAEVMPTKQVLLSNRTIDKAESLSQKYNITNVSDETLSQMLAKSDFLISTAAVEEAIFTPQRMKDVDLQGKILIDLSMPRSISPELEKEGAQVINLDYLKDIQNETFSARKESVPQAEAIVEEELNEYFEWIRQHDMRPTMHALKEKLQLIKEVEVKRLRKKNQEVDEDQINQIAEALINKVTTQCVKHVKKNNGNSLDLIHEIFELQNV